ncbi:TonB-linked SusC/RagA family outer membrane protein [Marinoscillum furvescens DSM 4134]|uniref:TonB-linked SusC/RagA family outer membrane protein n=2 Tax=Marinoscillum furvescens TaxID=1026 RepID=A0A3D9L3V0_MARFU|nr:TonB-linked SusC/RagA family outer membrane protein [Marinoscillum furvescens DSM 4134]
MRSEPWKAAVILYRRFGSILPMIILMYCSLSSAMGQSKTMDEVFVTLNDSNTQLITVLNNIESQTGFQFLYNEGLLDINESVSIAATSQPVGSVLRDLSKESGLTFRRVNNDVYVSVKDEEPQARPQVPEVQDSWKLKGRVTAEDSPDGIPGATVAIKGTGRGTVTDVYGNYVLEVSRGDVLTISYIGYSPREIQITDQTMLDIDLEMDLSELQEVVVIGYGTTLKSDMTGSVASVGSEELTAFPASGVTQALQGRAPGLSVQSNNGDPGGNFKVRIRGGTSINASSDPLYVVDGFPTGSAPPAEDIESVEILKDASATAIYGSRGANGVIMITTKRGKDGKAKIDFRSSYSVQSEINKLDLLNASEFAEYMNAVEASAGRDPMFDDPASLGEGTDWQEEILRPGAIQNHSLSISGGNDNVKYYISGIYYDHKGIIHNSDFKRYSVTSNLDVKASERVNLGLNLFVRRSEQGAIKTQETSSSAHNQGVVGAAYKFSPTLDIYDENGDFTRSIIGDPSDNPYALATERQSNTEQDRVQPNIYAEVKLLEDLKFRSNVGAVISNERRGYYVPRSLIQGESLNGVAELTFRRKTTLLNENYFTYSKDFGNHNLSVVAGYSFQSFDNEYSFSSNQTFVNDAGIYWNMGGGTNLVIPGSSLQRSVLSSYYGRLNYGYKSKYLLTITNRYDGASNFAKNNKWAYFPSAALGWNVHNESFMNDLSVISELKLRASYGVTGNQAIDPYQTLATIEEVLTTQQGNIVNAIAPATIANNDLTWESTSQVDIGADIGLFEDRILITTDYYKMITRDLLFSVPLPEYSGFSTVLKNAGKVENRGFELGINARNLVGAFRWDMDINFSVNRNKILELSDTVDVLYKNSPGAVLGGENQILRVGQPVGMFYGFVYEGVQQEGEEVISGGEGVGGEKFKDLNNDGKLSAEDRTIMGNPNPDFIWGFNNTFTYKGFDLNIFFQGTQGNDIANYTRFELDGLIGKSNATAAMKRSWTPENTNTDVPAIKSRPARFSSRWIEDGSYVRLKSVALGYKFPASVVERMKLRSFRVYVSGQNLWTATNYTGVDPEVSFRSSGKEASNRNLGLDFASYPMAKSFTVGVSVGF